MVTVNGKPQMTQGKPPAAKQPSVPFNQKTDGQPYTSWPQANNVHDMKDGQVLRASNNAISIARQKHGNESYYHIRNNQNGQELVLPVSKANVQTFRPLGENDVKNTYVHINHDFDNDGESTSLIFGSYLNGPLSTTTGYKGDVSPNYEQKILDRFFDRQ